MKETLIPTIELIGDEVESFYKLGQFDKEHFLPTIEHINCLLKTKFRPLNSVVEGFMSGFLKQRNGLYGESAKLLKSYSEGLEYPFQDLAYSLLVPELVASMHKWIPKGPPLGCSSFITKQTGTDNILHGRILDFPLKGTYDQHERIVKYSFNKDNKIIGLGSAGLPFPGLTSMNEAGMTFAIHQKFTPVMNLSGSPIFEIVYDLLKSGIDNSIDALDFLKSRKSITTWCLILTFKNSDVLVVDLMGDEFSYEKYNASDKEILYFNNDPIDSNLRSQDFLPYGIKPYNQMRRNTASKKIEKILKTKNINEQTLLSMMGSPVEINKSSDSTQWCLDCLSPSTIGNFVMASTQEKLLYIPGETPKTDTGKLIECSDIWNTFSQKEIKTKSKKANKNFQLAYSDLMQAQVHWDQQDTKGAFHLIQMAKSRLKGLPEETTIHFFFLVFQYLCEKEKSSLAQILIQFTQLEGKLPPYLDDHLKLFIFRLSRIMNEKYCITEEDIESAPLKKVFKRERIIPALLLHRITTAATIPRLDMLDILYPHAKA